MMEGPVKDVLLVEDNPSDIELTLHALAAAGCEGRVHVARTGGEALDFLRATNGSNGPGATRLVILDLKLPKLGGLELLEIIRGDPHLHLTPVVLFTSSREPRDVAAGYRLGANSYVVKPMRFESYRETVSELARYWLNLNVPPSGDTVAKRDADAP